MKVGSLEIELAANVARLKSDLDKAERIVGDTAYQIKTILGTIGVGLSVTYFKQLITGAVDAMDRLDELNKITTVSVRELVGLQLAAKQSGGDLESIATAVNKLSQEMGKSPAAFRALGVSAQDPLKAFGQLGDVLRSIEEPHQRAAVAAAALGKGWAGAAPLLLEGSQRMAQMVARGSELYGITEQITRQADQFNDKVAELNAGFDGMKMRLASELLPLMDMLVTDMIDVRGETGNLGASFSPLLETMKALVVTGGTFAYTFRTIGIAMAGVAEQARGFQEGGIQGFLRSRSMMTGILDEERRKFDEWEKKVMGVTAAVSAAGARRPGDAGPGLKPPSDAAIRGLLGGGGGGGASKKPDNIFNETQRQILESEERNFKAMEDHRKAVRAMEDERAAFAVAELERKQQQENAAQEMFNAEQQRMVDQGALVAQGLLTQTEQEAIAYAKRQDNLLAYLHSVGADQAQSKKYLEALEIEHLRRALERERQRHEFVRGMQIGTWQLAAGLLQSFAGKSREAAWAAILITKGLAMAQVQQATAVAIMRAYSDLGPIAGSAWAAKVGALGSLQMGLIAASGLVEASNVGAGGADLGSPANPVNTTSPSASPLAAAPSGAGQTTIVHFTGTQSERALIRKFSEMLNENARDGGRLIVTG